MQRSFCLGPGPLRHYASGRSRVERVRVRGNLSPTNLQQPVVEVEEVLKNLRKTSPELGPNKEAHVHGRGRHLGISINWSLRWRPDGAFCERIVGKELQFSWGHDGSTASPAWELDSSGVSRQLDCDDHEALLTCIWLRTGLWLYPPISRLLHLQVLPPIQLPTVQDVAAAPATPAAPLVLSVKLSSGRLVTRLRICPNKWVVQGLDQPLCGDVESWQLGNWKTWPTGVTYPTELVHSSVGGGQHAYLTEEGNVQGPSPLDYYQIPASPLLPVDTTYDESKSATVSLWRAASGHLLVQPQINDTSIGFMVLDTGASGFVITPEAATEMGMESFGELFAACIAGKVASKFVKADSWQLGPIRISKPVMMTMDLAGLVHGIPGNGEVIGIVGYDLFRRSVVQLPAFTNLSKLDGKSGSMRTAKSNLKADLGSSSDSSSSSSSDMEDSNSDDAASSNSSSANSSQGVASDSAPTVTVISNGAQHFSMVLHHPDKEILEGDWDWKPFRMVSNLPHLEASFPDESGEVKDVLLMLDTGACGSDIMLHPRAVRELQLSPTKPSKRGGSGSTQHVVRGVGAGSSEGVRVEVKRKPWAEVAGLRYDQVRIMITGMTGLDISIYSSGIVCADLITRRPMVIDYTRRRIGLPKPSD